MKASNIFLIVMLILMVVLVACAGDEDGQLAEQPTAVVAESESESGGLIAAQADEDEVQQSGAEAEDESPSEAADKTPIDADDGSSFISDEHDVDGDGESADPLLSPPALPEEITIDAADGLAMAGTFYPAAGEGPWPGLMLLHMNGGRRQDWGEVAPQLAEAGYAVLALDMRGFGETGGDVDWGQVPEDLQEAWAYLEGRDDVDGSRMAPIGGSIGSSMALLTAVDNPELKTAVLLSPGLNYFGVTTDDEIVEYGQRPILIVASEEDTTSSTSSRQLEELALGEVHLEMYDGAGHGTRMFSVRPELTDLILDWLDVHVKGQDPSDSSETTAGDAELAISSPFDVDWDDRSPYLPGLTAAEAPILDQLPGASIYHMDLTISPDLLTVTGKQEVRYTNQETVDLDEIYFHLYPNILGGSIDVSGVMVDGQTVDPTYSAADSIMGVPLAEPLAPGEQVVIGMDYTVGVPTEGGSNYGVFATIDDVLALAHFYPQVAVYNDEDWQIDFPSENADVTYADASFYLTQVTAPADQVMVVSGVEVGGEVSGDAQMRTYAAGPARDFYLATSDRYELLSEMVGETTVNSYGFPEYAQRNDEVLAYASNAIEVLNDLVGPYPYTEFDVAPTPNLALAVEYPGVAVVTSRLYDPDALINDIPTGYFIESSTAHEAVHQWFYNTVGNDQVNEPWLDESLTQYVTYLYHVNTYGRAAAENYRQSFFARWDRVLMQEIPIGMPAGNYSGSEYSAIVYGRGPLFFEALSAKMGEELFLAFLRDYYEQNKWSLSTAETLKSTAEAHCDCDLTEIFEEWVEE